MLYAHIQELDQVPGSNELAVQHPWADLLLDPVNLARQVGAPVAPHGTLSSGLGPISCTHSDSDLDSGFCHICFPLLRQCFLNI